MVAAEGGEIGCVAKLGLKVNRGATGRGHQQVRQHLVAIHVSRSAQQVGLLLQPELYEPVAKDHVVRHRYAIGVVQLNAVVRTRDCIAIECAIGVAVIHVDTNRVCLRCAR